MNRKVYVANLVCTNSMAYSTTCELKFPVNMINNCLNESLRLVPNKSYPKNSDSNARKMLTWSEALLAFGKKTFFFFLFFLIEQLELQLARNHSLKMYRSKRIRKQSCSQCP